MNKKIITWALTLFIPIVLLLSYLIDYAFEFGFYSYFKIPTEFIQTDILNRLQIFFFIFPTLLIFMGSLLIIYTSRKSLWLLLSGIPLILIFLYQIIKIIPSLWKYSTVELILISVFTLMTATAIALLIFSIKKLTTKIINLHKSINTRIDKATTIISEIENILTSTTQLDVGKPEEIDIDKIKKQKEEVEYILAEDKKAQDKIKDINDTIKAYNLFLIIAIIITPLVIMFLAGLITAKNKSEFYIYQNKSQEMVILKIYGKDMLCTPLNRSSKSVEPKFMLIKAEELQKDNIFIKPEIIGPLKVIKNYTFPVSMY